MKNIISEFNESDLKKKMMLFEGFLLSGDSLSVSKKKAKITWHIDDHLSKYFPEYVDLKSKYKKRYVSLYSDLMPAKEKEKILVQKKKEFIYAMQRQRIIEMLTKEHLPIGSMNKLSFDHFSTT